MDEKPEAGRIQGVPAEVLLAAVQSAYGPIAVMDDEGLIAYTNDAFRTMGFEPGEINGRPGLEFVHPDDIERAAIGLSVLLDTGASVATPFRMQRKDGQYVSLDASSTLVEAEGRQWMAVAFHAVPFHIATARTLELLAGGSPIEVALGELAAELSAADGVEATVGIAFEQGGRRVTVGPLDPVLALEGPWDDAIARGEPYTIGDVADLATVDRSIHERAVDLGYVAATMLPAEGATSDQRPFLALWYRSTLRKPFVDLFFEGVIRDVVRLAVRVGRERGELEFLARHDPLTGLSNRRAFFEALDGLAQGRRAADPATLAVVYLDLDDFKPVNDTYGHAVGDALLQAAAQRFRDALRPGDVLARLGGDEFAALCPGVADVDEGVELATRLVAAAAEPYVFGSVEVHAGSTAGIAFVSDVRAMDPPAVLREADEALYRAKRSRKGTVGV